MSDGNAEQPTSLLNELKRRRVLYAAGVYGVTAFAATEAASFVFENLGVGEWANRLLAALFVAGFPVAMFLSWVFDFGTEGIVRSPSRGRRNPRAMIAIALVLLVAATAGLYYLVFPSSQAPTPAVPATQPATVQAPDYGFEPAEQLANSVAVLPFENLSADPDNAFFSSGVAEEILNQLGAYRELNIIGRTSSFAIGNSDFPAPKISAMLGVRYLLQGSVRRHQDQVRVSTQLLDENGVQVWSRNFDRQLTDIFAIQTEIAVEVATAVVPQVGALSLNDGPPELEAYDHFLKGRALVYQRNALRARDTLETAVALDPDFAPAHAELAIAHAMGADSDLDAAQMAVQAALSLRPGLLRARAARGLILMQQRPPDFAAAERVLSAVLDQQPNMTDAVLWLSNVLGSQGRAAESNAWLERGVRMDPLHPTLTRNLVNDLAGRGEFTKAEAVARRVIEAPNNRSFYPYVALFSLYQNQGRLGESAEMAREYMLSPLDLYCYCLPLWSTAALGDWDAAGDWLERSHRDFGPGYFIDRFEILFWQWQGEYGQALKKLKAHLGERGETAETGTAIDTIRWSAYEAFTGFFKPAIARLEPLLDQPSALATDEWLDGSQTLAWAHALEGNTDRAATLLTELESQFAELERQGTLLFGQDGEPYAWALNALLLGHQDQALDRLEAIIDAGWRLYYLTRHDPRWDALRDHPRFQALMARVKADVDRQRAELNAMESHEAFVARLYATRDDLGPNGRQGQ